MGPPSNSSDLRAGGQRCTTHNNDRYDDRYDDRCLSFFVVLTTLFIEHYYKSTSPQQHLYG